MTHSYRHTTGVQLTIGAVSMCTRGSHACRIKRKNIPLNGNIKHRNLHMIQSGEISHAQNDAKPIELLLLLLIINKQVGTVINHRQKNRDTDNSENAHVNSHNKYYTHKCAYYDLYKFGKLPNWWYVIQKSAAVEIIIIFYFKIE